MTLPIFIINLDRIPERWEFVLNGCKKLGLKNVTRWSAVDAQKLEDYKIENYAPEIKGSRWEITKGEIACFESHRRLWQHIIDIGYRRALILEDDVLFSENFGNILKSIEDVPTKYKVIKMDRHNYPTMRHGPVELATDDYSLLPVIQKSSSSACYLVTQSACRLLVEKSHAYNDTLDDFITNPKLNLNVFQLFPAHAVQIQFANDIEKLNQAIPLNFCMSELASNPKLNRRNKGPIWYRLNKELKRLERRLHWLATDRNLRRSGGTIGSIPSGF